MRVASMGALKKKGPDKMPKNKVIFLSLFALIILVLFVNFYFAFIMNKSKYLRLNESSKIIATSGKASIVPSSSASSSKKYILLDSPIKIYESKKENVQRRASLKSALNIEEVIRNLPPRYLKPSLQLKNEISRLWLNLQLSVGTSIHLWAVANEWVGARHVVPSHSPLLGSVLKTMNSAKIVKAQNAPGGTQLKLLITLEGGQKALFKPQWYKRDDHIEGPVYSGKDRHNAEVAAFHLSLLLGLRRVPLTVGRKVNLHKEIMPVASKSLLKTFSTDGLNNTCFYGNCHYCSSSDAVCGSKEWLEGAVILMLPENFKLKQFRSPWQRTYKENKAAKWEVDSSYCETLKTSKMYSFQNGPRLLDLVDAAIFDFLIDNGDRHHYEVLVNISGAAVMFIDNGKSFGHPFQDHLDILAPLYQCCVIRQTTWERLSLFTGDKLGSALEKLLLTSSISPVLTSHHINAVNRRLRAIFAGAEVCFQKFGKINVVIDDGYR